MLFSGCCLSDLALNLFSRRFGRDTPAELPIKCSVVDNGTRPFDSKKKTAHLESPSKTSAYSSMKSTAAATMSGLAIPAAGEIVTHGRLLRSTVTGLPVRLIRLLRERSYSWPPQGRWWLRSCCASSLDVWDYGRNYSQVVWRAR